MTDIPPEGARLSPSTARNRQPILKALAPRLSEGARVLEVASGAGGGSLAEMRSSAFPKRAL